MNLLTFSSIQKGQNDQISQSLSQTSNLLLPSQADLLSQGCSSKSIFKPATQRIKSLISQKLRSGEAIRAADLKEDNSVLKVFTFILLVIIYGQQNVLRHKKKENGNLDLLNRLENCLYSKDMKNYQSQNWKCKNVKSQQSKRKVASFLKFIENFQKNATHKKLVPKCIQWILHKNEHLFQVFIFSIRPILGEIKVDVDNVERVQSNPETILPLFQYFGLKATYQNGCILLFETGYFLTFIHKSIVYGTYNSKEISQPHAQNASRVANMSENKQQTSISKQYEQKLESQFIATSFLFNYQANTIVPQVQSKLCEVGDKRVPVRKVSKEEFDFVNQQLIDEFAKIILDSDVEQEGIQLGGLKSKGQLTGLNMNQNFCRYCSRRFARNSLSSKVVNFAYEPILSSEFLQTPSFQPEDYQMKQNESKIIADLTKEPQCPQRQYPQRRKDKIPTFLKCKILKESQVTVPKRSISKNNHRQRNKNESFFKATHKSQSQNIFNFRNQTNLQCNFQQTIKENTKDYTQSNKMTPKRHYFNHIRTQSVLGPPLRTRNINSSFYDSPQCRGYMLNSDQLKMLRNEQQTARFKFFAPVQIIAPTVYLNSTDSPQNPRFSKDYIEESKRKRKSGSQTLKRSKTAIFLQHKKPKMIG